MPLYLYSHAFQQGDEVTNVKDIWNIADGDAAGSEQHGAYDLKSLVLGALRGYASTQTVTTFYYK